jgi:hypothetical protein
LCLPHLRKAIETCRDSTRRDLILRIHRDTFRRLLAELDEYVRKNDYRFSGETHGAERDAWRRAVYVVHGWHCAP